MDVRRLTPDLAVGAQIAPGDVAMIAALGFRSIIGNRPDGEAADQPAFSRIAAAAHREDVLTRHIPVVASAISHDDVAAFRQAMGELPKPIFAFCRTGTRAALLWALANTDRLTVEERMRTAAAQGYDLSAFRDRIAAAS